MEVHYSDLEFEVEVTHYTPSDPGKTFGLPEDCYPPEAEELEFEVTEDNPIAEFITEMLETNETFYENVYEQVLEEITS